MRTVTQRMIGGIMILLHWTLLIGLPTVTIMTAIVEKFHESILMAFLSLLGCPAQLRAVQRFRKACSTPASFYIVNLFFNDLVAALLFTV